MNIGPAISSGNTLRQMLQNCDRNLNVAHVNCQSISPALRSVKLDELKCILRDSGIHVMGLSETWLKPYVLDKSVSVPGYSICRNDRPSGRGGGVGLLIANGIKYKKVFSSDNYGICESLFVEIFCESGTILVGVTYLPHGDIDVIENVLGDLFMQYNNIVLMGDFNNNLFDHTKAHNIRSICSRLGLAPLHNSIPTHWDLPHNSTSLIDFFLLSDMSKVRRKGQFSVPSLSHHALHYVSMSFDLNIKKHVIEYRAYDRTDHSAIKSYVDDFDFSAFYLSNCVNYKLTFLNGLLTNLFQFVPLVRFTTKCSKDPWMCRREVVLARNLRDRAYSALKNNPTEVNRRNFCRLRNKLKSTIRKFRRRHQLRIFDTMEHSKVWRYLGNCGLVESENNVLIDINLNDLNESFVFDNRDSSLDTFDSEGFGFDGFSFNCVDIADLCSALSKVSSNAIGTDGFPVKFIKIIFPYVLEPFLHLVNMIITTSVYPSDWKLARVVPIPKGGSSHEFRPISILPCLSKIVEHLLKMQMLEHISVNNMVRDFQCAYRNGYNASSMLMGITDNIRENLNNNGNCILVSLDMSKAFDRLDHSILITKLRDNFGFSVMACKLIYSYLRGRMQFVNVGGMNSDISSNSSGVPQGSVLGPLLFLMYVDDCVNSLDLQTVKPFLFADDIQLLFNHSYDFLDVLEENVNFNIDNLLCWMVNNGLLINASKTKAIMFRNSSREVVYPTIKVGDEDIRFVDSFKCLGVILDDRLNFGRHMDVLSTRVTFGLRRLYNNGVHLPTRIKYMVAHALLMSHVNYCLEVTSGTLAYNLRKLELVVNRIVKFVFGLRKYDHTSCAVRNFLSMPFSLYIRLRNLIFFYKIIKLGLPNFLFEKFSFSRSKRNPQIIFPLITNSLYERSFVTRIARIWNTLPIELRSFNFSVYAFRRKLILHLQSLE